MGIFTREDGNDWLNMVPRFLRKAFGEQKEKHYDQEKARRVRQMAAHVDRGPGCKLAPESRGQDGQSSPIKGE